MFKHHNVHLVLTNQRWFDFITLTTRSFLCILITTSKNLYDAYLGETIVYLPPDERSIEQLEGVLHNPVAIDYFYEYLESLEQENDLNDNTDCAIETTQQTLVANHDITELKDDLKC
jgi:hypothetical protein